MEIFPKWHKHLLVEYQYITCPRLPDKILAKFNIEQGEKAKMRESIKEAVQ